MRGKKKKPQKRSHKDTLLLVPHLTGQACAPAQALQPLRFFLSSIAIRMQKKKENRGKKRGSKEKHMANGIKM